MVFSYARSARKLQRLASKAGDRARAGTPADAARDSDVLLLAVHWSRLDDVLKQAGSLSGKIVVTCSLPMNTSDTGLVVAHTSSGAEVLAKRVPRAKVVAAFGTVPSEVLFASAGTPERSELPQGLARIVSRCLEKNPRERFQTVLGQTLTRFSWPQS